MMVCSFICSCSSTADKNQKGTATTETTYAKIIVNDDSFAALHPEAPYYYESISSNGIADFDTDKQYKCGVFMVSDFNEGICINEYVGESSSVKIPDEINGKAVIRIGSTVKNNGDGGYSDASAFNKFAVQSVYIPKTVKYIDCGSFTDVNNQLYKITVDSDNPYYSSENGVLYNKDKSVLIDIPCRYKEKSLVVPNSVRCVYEADVYPDIQLKLVLHKDVEMIYFSDVYYEIDKNNKNYSSIDGVVFDKAATELLYYPFNDAKEYTVPDSVKFVNDDYNLKSNVYTITFGKNISKISLKLEDESGERVYPLQTVKGYKDTAAEKYAKENALEFIALD